VEFSVGSDEGDDKLETMAPGERFFTELRRGRFMAQRDRQTGKVFRYPRVIAPGTGSVDLEWIELSGLGTIYSTTTVRVRPPAVDYNVALVDLDEGCRMMSRVEGIAPDAVSIGMRVKARIAETDTVPVVVFDPMAL